MFHTPPRGRTRYFQMNTIAPPEIIPASAPCQFERLQKRANNTTGPNTAPKPALLAGTILAGILASTMSTADSQLLAASFAVSSDLFGDRVAKTGDKKKAMNAARFTLLAIAVIAAFIARDPNSSVFGIVSFAWAGFGAVFGPVVFLPSSGDAQTGRAHLPE